MKDLAGLAGGQFVVALTEATKVVFPGIPSRFYVLVAIAWAIALNMLVSLVIATHPVEAVLEGLAAGLAASGLYSVAKHATSHPLSS